MGKRGETRTAVAREAADDLVGRLSGLGEVTSKGMFGGYGVFCDGVMFGLVNRAGVAHLRVTGATEGSFTTRGAKPHGKMPYYEIPADVLEDPDTLRAWAEAAAAGAQAAKKG